MFPQSRSSLTPYCLPSRPLRSHPPLRSLSRIYLKVDLLCIAFGLHCGYTLDSLSLSAFVLVSDLVTVA